MLRSSPFGPIRRLRSTPSPRRVISAKSSKTLKAPFCGISVTRRRIAFVPISMAANRLGLAFARFLLRKLDFIAALLFTAVPHPAGALGYFLDENGLPALRTFLRHRTIPRGEFAIGVTAAPIKNLAAAGLPLLQIAFLTFGTADAQIHRLFERAHVFTFRIAGAAQEAAIFPPADLHRSAALLTRLIHLDFFNDLHIAARTPREILCVLTFGIARAGEKLSIASPFHNHHSATLLAGNVGRNLLAFHIPHLGLGLLKIARE